VGIGRAPDWSEFRQALTDWSVGVFNFVCADRDGGVGYQCAGRVPIRGRVRRGFREANHPDDQWQGSIPFDALPRQEQPARGYVASANQRVAPDDYPYPMHGAWAAGYRGVRIDEALASASAIEPADVVALQNDVKSTRAEQLCPPLVRRLRGASDPA